MTKKQFTILFSVVLVIVLGVATFFFLRTPQSSGNNNLGGTLSNTPLNVIGTRGTSTPVGVVFPSSGPAIATTTYKTFIGTDTDRAIYQIGIITASTSAKIHFSVMGSYDDSCDTATTSSPIMNEPLVGTIRWFDIGNHIRNSSVITSLSSATSTIIYSSPKAGANREIVLEDLNYRCLALGVNASTTEMWVQLLTK